MDISVHCDGHGGVPQYFTQALDVKPQLDTACGKRMPQGMEIRVFHLRVLQRFFEAILHDPWFNKRACAVGQQIALCSTPILHQDREEKLRDRDGPDGAGAFGWGD